MTAGNDSQFIFQQVQGKAQGFIYTHEEAGKPTCRVMVLIPEGDPQGCLFQVVDEGQVVGPCLSAEKAADFIRGEGSRHVKDALRTALLAVVKACVRQRQAGAALSVMEHVVAATEDPEAAAALRLALGCELEGLGDFSAAARCYGAAQQHPPADPHVRYFINNNLGYSLNQLGRHQEAEPHCREAIRIDPARFNAYKNLGVALDGQERTQEAAECYVRAAEIAPGDMRAACHLRALLGRHPDVAAQRPDFLESIRRIYGDIGTVVLSQN